MERFTPSEFKYWPHIVVIIILCLAFVAYHYFAYYNTRTSDAYVSANVVNMTPMVSGPITKLYVVDNQFVKKSEKILEIDARPYEFAFKKAEQALKIAQQSNDKDAIILAKLTNDESKYLLDHTTIVAPADGYVTNLRIRQGQYLKKGDALFALVETKHWWVVGRYRETALRLIKPGDKAKISLDMYPGVEFHGHVNSIGWGINRIESGTVAPSTLAYLEATEDWIKIAQRFPVFITIDDLKPEYPLRVGASAVTKTYR